MTTVRLVHIVAAFTLLASGLVRTIWLLTGNRFARWSAFIPTSRRQATELFRQAAFYAFLRKELPKVLGHNQLAAAAYLMLWLLLLLETVTGFALDGLVGGEPGATGFAWLREVLGPQALRVIHHGAMWAILAIAVFHVYSCILVDHLERNGLLSSIVSGYKFPTREEVVDSRDGGAEMLERLE
jgi:Ni/Fe-hydrogenase 1 B-type cytochrome subunit